MTAVRPKILLIDDNPDFGGHQVMAAYGLEGILRYGRWEVQALRHPLNEKNLERWSAMAAGDGAVRLRTGVSPTQTGKFQAVRRHFQKAALNRLHEIIVNERPDLVLLIQGNIEQCCTAFLLKGRVTCPVLSYIPVPHKHAEMGAKLGALRDLTCRGLYAEPDGFITISETLAGMLRDYGATGRIQVVENGIPLERFESLPGREEARQRFGLPKDGFIWGQVGRTEFKQKGQDFALDLFLERTREKEDEHLAFLGSGPDSERLKIRAAGHSNVHCLPWTEDPSSFYAAVDALIMPSRYEGVPLAMLEAIASAVPVASTDRDGMRDWLPDTWRFKYRDLQSGLGVLDSVRRVDTSTINDLKDRVWRNHSIEAFQRSFNAGLEEWLAK
ncbi:MAG: glycosyltransferase family 4 protein [Opitutales bacterium]